VMTALHVVVAVDPLMLTVQTGEPPFLKCGLAAWAADTPAVKTNRTTAKSMMSRLMILFVGLTSGKALA